jgi:hypothetical protein
VALGHPSNKAFFHSRGVALGHPSNKAIFHFREVTSAIPLIRLPRQQHRISINVGNDRFVSDQWNWNTNIGMHNFFWIVNLTQIESYA